MSSDYLWYRDQKELKIGDVQRYKFEYTTLENDEEEIFLRIKNMENTGLRAIHLLNGPFILYCHIIPHNYDHKRPFCPQNAGSNSEVYFKNTLKPGQTFNVRMYLNENSVIRKNNDGYRTYGWEVEVVSQIIINRKAAVKFDLMVGTDIMNMRRLNRSAMTSMAKGDFIPLEHSEPKIEPGEIRKQGFKVKTMTTDDIWSLEPNDKTKPVHLVIITHGLFSNLTADMLYLRDQIASIDTENLIISGYRGNAGRTEKGIHKLGIAVSAYVTNLLDQLRSSNVTVSDISFVGHSLGGPVQLYAIKNILQVKGTDYFVKQNIKLKHFVCLASPMLGVLSEMNLWIAWFLDLGTLGKTGRDLTLSKKFHGFVKGKTKSDAFRPILEALPDEPIRTVLQDFESLTVYANSVNDGIVPLRTSSLLYLDWTAMGSIDDLRQSPNHLDRLHPSLSTETNSSGHDVGPVPAESETSDKNITGFRQKKPSLMNSLLQKERHSSRKARRYARISAKSSESWEQNSSKSDDVEDDYETQEDREFFVPPKASAVESAINTLICPAPSMDFVMDPSRRVSCIFHDRYYRFDKVPEDEDEKKGHGFFQRVLNLNDWRIEKQVKIARKYHDKGMNWRKVLVFLPPDAHNNIVVRRRFANGFGWGVVDHLRDEIFCDSKLRAKM